MKKRNNLKSDSVDSYSDDEPYIKIRSRAFELDGITILLETQGEG